MICQKLRLALEIRKMKERKNLSPHAIKDLSIVIGRHKINHFGVSH